MTENLERSAPEQLLRDQLAELAEALVREQGEPPDPQRVVHLVATALPHSDHCSLTFLRPGRAPRSIATSSPLAEQVDIIQYGEREGPCLDAATGDSACLVEDLATDERWPRFAPRCVRETGVRAMLALRLPIGGDDEAAINVFAHAPGSLSDEDVATLSLFATSAALAVQSTVHEQDIVNLEAALDGSRQIGRAVGIIMTRHAITSDEAFHRLRRASQDLNRKLREVAAEVELTGTLPESSSAGDTTGHSARGDGA